MILSAPLSPARADTLDAIETAASFGLQLQYSIPKCNLPATAEQRAALDAKVASLVGALKAANRTTKPLDETCPNEDERSQVAAILPAFLTLSPEAIAAKLGGGAPAGSGGQAAAAPEAPATPDPALAEKQRRLGKGLALSYGVEACDIPTTTAQRGALTAKLGELEQQTGISTPPSAAEVRDMLDLKDDASLKTFCLGLKMKFPGLLAEFTGDAPPANGAAAPAPDPERQSRVEDLVGAGIALQQAVAACDTPTTDAQRQRIAGKLKALKAESGLTADALAEIAKVADERVAAARSSAAGYCANLGASLDSNVDALASEVPSAQWAARAQSTAGAPLIKVGDWTVDPQGCNATYSYFDHDDDNALNGIFVGKLPQGVAVTLQYQKWDWSAGEEVEAKTLVAGEPTSLLRSWHADKKGAYLSAVLPRPSLAKLAGGTKIVLRFPKADGGGEAEFNTPDLGGAIAALSGCEG